MSDPGHTDAAIPDDWQTVSGPAHWYSLRCPPDAVIQQSETCLEIRPTPNQAGVQEHAAEGLPQPDGVSHEAGPALVILSMWIEANLAASLSAFAEPATLFPDVLSVQEESAPVTGSGGYALSGTSRRPSARRGLLRI
ncbi:MAG: hypothetical protein KDA85_07380, partial [Planctomycetaceae bacterium]|nr:hypothetical protein [Planctomycetaceae bacterium]